MSLNRKIARTAAAGAAIGTAIALALPGVASAADPYPAPTVSAKADGNNVITTVKDNGGGKNSDGEAVSCLNLGVPAIDALPLAGADLTPEAFAALAAKVVWGSNGITTTAADTIITDANTRLQGPLAGATEVPAGVYVSLGVCVTNPLLPTQKLESYAYDIVFVPGGIGSLAQGLGLGSQVLSLENGSSILLDQGSAFLGS